MGTAKTGIEWTQRTWNPVRGCSRVSEGCRNCYAEKIAARFSYPGKPFHLFADRSRPGSKWTGKVQLMRDQLHLPMRWRKPRRIFVNSMSDLFHEQLSFADIAGVFGVMHLADHHTYQILTKRAQRMFEFMEWLRTAFPSWTSMKHVWLGVSVEDQKTADERIPWLLRTPAAVRFISYEPALGPVDLTNISFRVGGSYSALHDHDGFGMLGAEHKALNWVIAGGESGPLARPAHPDWFRSVRDQCVEAGVPFFFKQNGAWASGENVSKGKYETRNYFNGHWKRCADDWITEKDSGPIMYRVGKRKAGALLDGQEWKQFPEERNA